ncbi:MAG: PEP-CTERM sorting domain-containing protein [Planctomycetota bacterium]|jgi:hypothetical protein
MMAPNNKKVVISIVCMVFMLTNFSYAVFVELGDSGWAMVVSPLVLDVGDITIPWYQVDNDMLLLELHKTFSGSLIEEEGIFQPIVFEFQKVSENATSTIVLTDEYIVNDTGYEWYDFHMKLMVSLFNPEAGFDPAFVFDGHQLEQSSYSEFMGYSGLPIALDFVNTEGGGVPFAPPGEDIFWPGYESGQLVIVTDPEMGVGDRFGLKELPSIPEPATMMLLGVGALLVVARKRRLI